MVRLFVLLPFRREEGTTEVKAFKLAIFATLIALGHGANGQKKGVTMLYTRDRTPSAEILDGWSQWSPRSEISPKLDVDALSPLPRGTRPFTTWPYKAAALRITCRTASEWGAWRKTIAGIKPGVTYRFTALYKAAGVKYERRSVSARLDWRDANGNQVRPPDYALDAGKKGDWTRVEHTAFAPNNAASVTLELALGWEPGGSVSWADATLVEAKPKARVVRVATVGYRPSGTKSAAGSVEEFCRIIDSAGLQGTDIICLPEGVTLVGNGNSYAEASEAVPGPTTARLGALARKHNSYLVAGIYERVGKVIYNTAVLLDRHGHLIGKYRKTHLPREEVEGGLTPGNSYPVFKTDFGTVGLMICWDVQFPEPARAMALKGAEVILLPIWGGSETLAKARAIENHVFLVSSSFDMKTFIVDPTGSVLAEATSEVPVAVADLKLDEKIVQPWLGDMKARTWKERRPDIPVN